MNKALAAFGGCMVLFLIGCSDGSDVAAPSCSLAADETSRANTARSLVTVNASNYQSLIDHWAEDVTYREPVLTSSGREEVLEYLTAMFSGSSYGFPLDRKVTIKDELRSTDEDGHMTYMATLEWSGTSEYGFFRQTGMSIVKFRAGEGCPYYQRDYLTEGDTWWNIPAFKPDINVFRNMYISFFGLTERCFDDDKDGFSKYDASIGCPQAGLDCNDFTADINPGMMEIQGNGIDEDCNVLTPIDSSDLETQSYQ